MKKTREDYLKTLEQLSNGVKERVTGNKMWKLCAAGIKEERKFLFFGWDLASGEDETVISKA